MSNMLNVDGSDDPSYRYKMPRLVSKVEGRGNGVKTVLVNCTDVALSLSRSSAQLTKFFGCEFGAMSKFEDKTDKSLVNGAFENKDLQESLQDYIAKFVLCPSCGNPETVQSLKGKKKQAVLYLNCKACGACDQADNTHKLLTFIVKELSETSDTKESKKDKKKKDKDKETKEKDTKDTKDTKDKKKVTKKKDSSSVNNSDSVSDGDKSSSTKERKKKTTASSKKKEVKEAEDDLGELSLGISEKQINAMNTIISKLSSDEFNSLKSEEKLTKAVELRKGCDEKLSSEFDLPIMFFTFVNSSENISSVLTNLTLLLKLKPNYSSSEAFQRQVLLCLEEVVSRTTDESKKNELVKRVPLVLKTLRDGDIVNEEMIIDWFNGRMDILLFRHERVEVGTKDVEAVKKSAKLIIEFFENEESEEESSEESD